MEDSVDQAKTVELLLDRCENPDLDELLCIVSHDIWKIETLRLLLQRGANPNAQLSDTGQTPLHLAVSIYRRSGKCNEAGIRSLLHYGADMSISDNKGITALTSCILDATL
jgi:ankyrin repeat protein